MNANVGRPSELRSAKQGTVWSRAGARQEHADELGPVQVDEFAAAVNVMATRGRPLLVGWLMKAQCWFVALLAVLTMAVLARSFMFDATVHSFGVGPDGDVFEIRVVEAKSLEAYLAMVNAKSGGRSSAVKVKGSEK